MFAALTTTDSRRSTRWPVLGLLVVTAAVLTGCAHAQPASSSAGRAAVPAPGTASAGGPQRAPATAAGSPSISSQFGLAQGLAPSGAGAATRSAALDLLTGRSIVRTAEMWVRVAAVLDASSRAQTLAASLGGFVAAEQAQAQPDRPSTAQAVLTLRVPATRLPVLVTDVERLGVLVSEEQSAQDVTGQVIDVAARIAAQRASVARVSALMARATTLGQVVQIEGELTRRQADLESLQGQAARLADQTALGTLTVTFVGPAAHPAGLTSKSAPPTGFGAGLARGWHAFAVAGTWLLTAAGTALPFAVLGGLILVCLVWVRRRAAADPVEAGPPLPPATVAG